MMKTRKYLRYLLIYALVTLALIASACLAPDEVDISLAPIHEVEVFFMESFPVQVGVYIKGGLRDGCTTFHDVVVTREGNTINIEVTTQHPKDTDCPAVYTFFEKNLNLGSDFTSGATYTLEVNDYTTTFIYP